MSTVTFTSPIDHTSNAGFDAWATEMFNNLAAVNAGIFAQTADTGQLATPVVAARPGTNTAAGYWIFKLNDSVSSTPLYFKIEPGTGSAATTPQFWLTVGTGTNGAGTLTGSVNTRSVVGAGTGPVSTVTNYVSRMCCINGFWGFEWKESSRGAGINMGFAAVMRTTDDNGTLNAQAFQMYNSTSSTVVVPQCTTVASAITLTVANTANVTLVPFNLTSSVTGTDQQYFRHFAAIPFMRPVVGVVTVIPAEFPVGATFAGEAGSITNFTYVTTGQPGGYNNNSNYNLAMIFQ